MEKLRKAKNILSINQMTYQSIAMEMRKSICHNTLPQTFSSICKNCTPDNRTRSYSQSLFRPPKCRLSSTMSSFSSKATSVWNKLPIELRDPKLSNASFKTKLKTWLKGTIIPQAISVSTATNISISHIYMLTTSPNRCISLFYFILFILANLRRCSWIAN